MKKIELLTFAGADELARAAASAWLDEIEAANRAGTMHCVALSGGRITQKFFSSAVEQGRARQISFGTIHFFWADERCVPPADADSNFKMADELLFAPLGISDDNIHRLRGELAPAEAVRMANEEILSVARVNQKNLPVLDLVLLGMGEDGHVASLFPNATEETLACVLPFLSVSNSPKPPPNRISLSFPAIAAATKVWTLISGAGKENAFRESIVSTGNTPLAKIVQLRDSTKIFSDVT